MKNGKNIFERFMQYIDSMKAESPEKLKKFYLGIVLVILLIFYVIGVVIQQTKTFFNPLKTYTWNPLVCLRYGLFTKEGWAVFLVVAAAILILSFVMVPKRAKINPAADVDDKGVVRKEYSTYGSARKMSEEEAAKYFDVGDIKNVEGMIFGQFDKNGKRVCAMRAKPTDNRNVFVVGSPGTGKSYALIRSAILQCINRGPRGESFAVVDPKGELFRDLYKYVKQRGYNSKIYNLVEPEYSDAWDCLAECFDEYGDYSPSKTEEFIDIVIVNTRSSDKPADEFFENGEKNMLAMFVNYVLQRYTNYVREEYREIITQLVTGMPDVQITQMEKVKEVFNHWRYARNMYGARAKMYNCRIPEHEITETMDLIQECVSAEEFYEVESRREALKKMEEYFGSKESNGYNPDVVHIYLEEMGQEKRWVMNKENLKKWCLTGISSAHRCDLRAVLQELAQFLGKSAIEAKEMTDTIEHGQATPVCTFTEVYYLIITMTPKDISLLFSQIDLSSPAGIAYCTYRDASETVQQSYKQGLSTRLSIFKDQNIRRITSNQDIDLSRVGAEPTALWIKISDTNKAYSFLTSLFFSFLIKDNTEAFDHAANPDKRMPITLFIDEAANVGQIKALPVAVANIRSRMIAAVLVVQKLKHLENIYGEEDAETILACCDYLAFLGSNDENSAKYMETRSGIQTIQVASEREMYKKFGLDSAIKNYMVTIGEGQRNVYNMDEIWTLEPRTMLLAKRGSYIVKLNTFPWIMHPDANGGELPKTLTIEYAKARDKYPYFDYCLDSFYCYQDKIAAMRRRMHMELPCLDLRKEAQMLLQDANRRCAALELDLEERDVLWNEAEEKVEEIETIEAETMEQEENTKEARSRKKGEKEEQDILILNERDTQEGEHTASVFVPESGNVGEKKTEEPTGTGPVMNEKMDKQGRRSRGGRLI